MSSPTMAAPDSNTMLIQLCVKALASVAPEGMTTKELAAALDKEVKGTPGFDGISSSILSSKLNAIFRRCHGDAAEPTRSQLAELPLTRSQSSEIPRRLVYRYTPAADSADVPDRHSTPAEDSSSGEESADLNEPLTPKEESPAQRRSSFGPAKKRCVSDLRKEDAYPAEPGTPPEIAAKDGVSQAIHGPAARESKKSEQIINSKTQTAEASAPRAKRPLFHTEGMGLNLYYDAVGLDAMSAALNLKQSKTFEEPSPSSDADREWDADSPLDPDWTDFPSPELLGLHELDSFVC